MTAYVAGIDGGGSSVRVALLDDRRNLLAESRGETVNPSVVGLEIAASRIHAALFAALEAAGLQPNEVIAAGIGVAGASASHSAGWLRDVVHTVLPQARVIPASDYEIALVGAHGERRGVLVLAGTGSLAYGINDTGDSALVGGWGYLLGDEGGGYWIGLEGLRAAIAAVEGRDSHTVLVESLLDALKLEIPRALIPWLYRAEQPRTRDIAALAPVVFAAASGGDSVAQAIVERGADALAACAQAVIRQLRLPSPAIAFTGGLLEADNPLSRALCRRLNLDALPVPRFSAVIGAALLALEAARE